VPPLAAGIDPAWWSAITSRRALSLTGYLVYKVVVDTTPRSWVGEMAAMEPAKSGVIALDDGCQAGCSAVVTLRLGWTALKLQVRAFGT